MLMRAPLVVGCKIGASIRPFMCFVIPGQPVYVCPPPPPLPTLPPQVCFAGRANVGKSSLLNALLGRPRAETGDMPGVTQARGTPPASLPPYLPAAALHTPLPALRTSLSSAVVSHG